MVRFLGPASVAPGGSSHARRFSFSSLAAAFIDGLGERAALPFGHEFGEVHCRGVYSPGRACEMESCSSEVIALGGDPIRNSFERPGTVCAQASGYRARTRRAEAASLPIGSPVGTQTRNPLGTLVSNDSTGFRMNRSPH